MPEARVNLQPASASNPGLPPSSLFSFLRAKPSIAGVLVNEFDRWARGVVSMACHSSAVVVHPGTQAFSAQQCTLRPHSGFERGCSTTSCRQYKNPYFQGGSYDTNVSLNALVAAASTIASALHTLASKGSNPPLPPLQVNWLLFTFLLSVVMNPSPVSVTPPVRHCEPQNACWMFISGLSLDQLQVNMSEVAQFGAALSECLLMDDPGMGCPLAKQLLDPDSQASICLFSDGWCSQSCLP